MKCPLRLAAPEIAKSSKEIIFEECYKDNCEWWIPENTNGPSACAIYYVGILSSLCMYRKENKNGKP
jgi:hypothetical protein